jgi:ArsR family transcriptional regulator, arsenate/arsenite/antimonite-responsive transcriptional repressor / arsenate reductase (thioredoxin)
MVRVMEPIDLAGRARRHAALSDPGRLAVVDALRSSDFSPSELSRHLDMPGNLLAHHLDVLEREGIIARLVSSGDRRRRYVRLRPESLAALVDGAPQVPDRVVFVCTHNSARSQLAAALWRVHTGRDADSAGTHPAERVHVGAIGAARRAGLDLSGATPRTFDVDAARTSHCVTVCDRAHEELPAGTAPWHWSVADPVEVGTDAAFDQALAELDHRIRSLLTDPPRTEASAP